MSAIRSEDKPMCPPPSPAYSRAADADSSTARLTRRSVLGLLAAAPILTLAVGPAVAEQPQGLVMYEGWMLRPDDLKRLNVA
jgi:hypothetical protein